MWIKELADGAASILLDGVKGKLRDRGVDQANYQKTVEAVSEALPEVMETLSETLQAEIASREKIMISEMAQGDKFTSRLRPTIGYVGLALILLKAVLYPIITAFSGVAITVAIPGAFWAAWAPVMSIYVIGRSVEKFGISNMVTKLITGAGEGKPTSVTSLIAGTR